MPPFAAAPPAMLQMNTRWAAPDDDELDSPVESICNMSLDDEAADGLPKPPPLQFKVARPQFDTRSSTDPSPTAPSQGYFTSPQQPPTSSGGRNRSPYSRSHLGSHSSGSSLLSAPVMTRAHSMPNPNISRPIETAPVTPYSPYSGSLSPGAPHSPMRSPRRVHSPFRQQQEEGYAPPRSPSFASGGPIESIQEDSELDITPRAAATLLPQPAALASFSRSASLRRRPASPLHSLANAPSPQLQHQQLPPTSYPVNIIDTTNSSSNTVTPTHHPSALSSASSSPALRPQTSSERFNEAYPSLHHYASTSSFSSSMPSSMPSTPTSMRSRSPSISSLDTIEDEPDMESEAIEQERVQRLKLAAERQERMERGEGAEGETDDGGCGVGVRRRSSLDVPRTGFGRGAGGGSSRDRERKRWSICGGERRGDLDLETIWED
ncbi:hypothetical protein LTR36_001547 [Oleoguttula mirabilis]|uniref:Basic proline-rich protein n=1 Tax=Oleoguttula mirabilis TaxID=1507867 RepID=A0AAV9JP64_9PEZI|nr:hypothetical protein LTR36_001547 [Oleoguttula mirabilis]